MPPKKSKPKQEYYVLELSVEPGGTRKNELYLLSNMVAVWETLQRELTQNADLAIWYGEDIILYRCKGNKVVEETDLHPFITFYIGKFKPIKFGKNNRVRGYKNKDRRRLYSDEEIDFEYNDINEVYRYLNSDTKEIFKIIHERNLSGGNFDRIPPNVGVQIDLSSLYRIENRINYFPKPITIKIRGTKYALKEGFNSFE